MFRQQIENNIKEYVQDENIRFLLTREFIQTVVDKLKDNQGWAYNIKLADALKRGKVSQEFSWKYLDNHILDLLNEIEGTNTKPKEKIHHSQINFDEDTCLVSINHIQ